ncbi:MAG: leucine-rich repeat protein [Spirochaetaceae bacterium]|jgi:hypothetical protein|nr:leucine-rich repeat protein [Spirochaetaceae bacterium]
MRNRKFLFGFAVCLLAAMGQAAFAQSAESDFETTVNKDGGVTITKYVGWDSVVKIPAALGGKAVTAIGDKAFIKQDNLTGVTIPDSVVSIGESAFETNKLASVTFGKGLVSIGKRAFYDNSLTNVTLPGTVESIGERAFSHNLLAKITLSGTGTRIGKYAFARNKQLTSVTLGSYFSFDGTTFIEEDNESHSKGWQTNDIGERGNNLFWDYVCNDMKAGSYAPDLKYRTTTKDGDFEYIVTRWGAALVKYNGESSSIRIPEKAGGLAVKHIGSNTFNKKSVERVLIPNGVTSIGVGAFSGKGLTSLVIPASVTLIGQEAFAKNRLKSIDMQREFIYYRDSFSGNNAITKVSSAAAQKKKAEPAAEYKIGDRGPAGGWIFYDKGSVTDGWRYLEAAPLILWSGWNAGWGDGIDVGDTSDDIGTGKQNTERIVAALSEGGKTGMAAQLCDELDLYGYDDWFLPSKEELDLMYKNLKKQGRGDFSDTVYWSSSEYANWRTSAWGQSFSGGYQANYGKDGEGSVRAVRAF